MIKANVRRLSSWFVFSFVLMASAASHAAPMAFDMGTAASPVAAGFVRVTAESAYTPESQYGWLAGMRTHFDTSRPAADIAFTAPPATLVYDEAVNDLNRDGVWSDGDLGFRVDLPNGKYRVNLTLGHLGKILGSIDVAANRELVARNVVVRHFRWRGEQHHGYGWHKPIRFTTEVKDGQLTIRLHGDDTEYQRLLAIERAKPRPESFLNTKDLKKRPRDYVLLTDIGQPFVGNSILGLEIYPYQEAPIELQGDKLKATGPAMTDAAVQEAVKLFNGGRCEAAIAATEKIGDEMKYERGLLFLNLAARPELDTERPLAEKAERDLAAAAAERPHDRRAGELLWVARHFREGIERFHRRGDYGANGYSESIRASVALSALQPDDPGYWKGLTYRARIYYMVNPHRWTWAAGAGRDLLLEVEKKFPDNRFVRLYLDSEWEPDEDWHLNDYVTGTEGDPDWAVACRDSWKTNLDMARWWIKNKQQEDGSLGGGWGDDVELIVDFANYVFVSEGVYPDVLEGARKQVDGNWKYSGIDDEAGFYWGVADVGHSAEPTTDTIPFMVFLEYGNPLWIERCMKSGKLMRDIWTAVNAKGHRHFRSNYLGAMGIAGGPFASDGWLNYRAVIPADKVLWYNNNPTLAKLFTEWARAMLEDSMKSEGGKPAGVMPPVFSFADCSPIGTASSNWYDARKSGAGLWAKDAILADRYPRRLLGSAYERTGDNGFLAPFGVQAELAAKYRANPVENPEEGTPAWVGKVLSDAQAPELWESIKAVELAEGPPGAPLTTREEAKESADFIRERVKLWWPLNTTDALVTDRVGFGGIAGIVDVYTGGNIFVGDPVISYVDFGTEFAALVLGADRAHLRVLIYSFYDEAKEVGFRPWRLTPGAEYRLTLGPDADRDGKLDAAEDSATVRLAQRGQAVHFRLPPKRETIVALEPVGQVGFGGARLTADPAIGPDDIEYWSDRNYLVARVHNIGSAPVSNLTVEAWAGAPGKGTLIGSSLIPYIEAPNDLVPQAVRAGFHWARGDEKSNDVWIVLDPRNEIPEIAEENNRCGVNIADHSSRAEKRFPPGNAAQ